jgi:hypothetical protein
MTTYPQKITLGEMRASGVRDVLIYCRNGARYGLFRMTNVSGSCVKTGKQTGDKDHLKVFDTAETWLQENDPDGAAFWSEPDQAAVAYRLLAALLILKSSICLPERNCATSQRGCLPRPAQVSDG